MYARTRSAALGGATGESGDSFPRGLSARSEGLVALLAARDRVILLNEDRELDTELRVGAERFTLEELPPLPDDPPLSCKDGREVDKEARGDAFAEDGEALGSLLRDRWCFRTGLSKFVTLNRDRDGDEFEYGSFWDSGDGLGGVVSRLGPMCDSPSGLARASSSSHFITLSGPALNLRWSLSVFGTVGSVLSGTPTRLSHHSLMAFVPETPAGHLYTLNTVPSSTQSVLLHFLSLA